MDKPTRLTGPNDSDLSGPTDSPSEQNIGATGVFESVKSSEAFDGPNASCEAEHVPKPAPVSEIGNPRPTPGAESLAEPVVHRVVLGRGPATDSMELLSRMRRASAEKAPQSKNPPSNEAGGTTGAIGSETTGREGSSAGFTQLLRSLGVDSVAPTASSKPILEPNTHPATHSDAFKSGLPPAGTAQSRETGFDPFAIAKHNAGSPAAEIEMGAVGTSEPGEFTKLLRAARWGSTDSLVFPKPDSGVGKSPEGSVGGAGGAMNPSENQPGEFTRLLSSLGGSAADSSSPTAIELEIGHSPRASGGSFTEMLAIEQNSAPIESGILSERKPAAGLGNFELPIRKNNETGADLEPFDSPERVGAPPEQSGQQGTGPGITRLIQMLDSPPNSPSPVLEPTPTSPASQAGPGAWTKTFTSLDDPREQPGVTAAKVPYRPVSQEHSGAAGAAMEKGTETSSRLNERAAPASSASSASAGPSEYTRIIDASRMRESAIRDNQASSQSPDAASQKPSAPTTPSAPQVQMPSYPISVAPGMVQMQGMGNMPHMGGVGSAQPLQVPGYPMNIGPHGGSIPSAGGSVPLAPGMYVPAIPQPSVPQAPPTKTAPTGLGKLQQYVPLLLILIIFLLVGLLVTVVFLLRH